MVDWMGRFEKIVRRASLHSESEHAPRSRHPFDLKTIHPIVSEKTRLLFDDGHYAQATFEAFKLIEKEVQQISRLRQSGSKLMLTAFNETSPKIKLNKMSNQTEMDEQRGFQFLFAGAMLAIRNRRGHEVGVVESPDECLEHLGLASLLLRRLDAARRTA